jgi:4-hydroxyphenylpyruvate dioxygenase
MEQWSGYYERLFNFREIRYFDIKGARPAWCPRR